jgi:hypothetical protein
LSGLGKNKILRPEVEVLNREPFPLIDSPVALCENSPHKVQLRSSQAFELRSVFPQVLSLTHAEDEHRFPFSLCCRWIMIIGQAC